MDKIIAAVITGFAGILIAVIENKFGEWSHYIKRRKVYFQRIAVLQKGGVIMGRLLAAVVSAAAGIALAIIEVKFSAWSLIIGQYENETSAFAPAALMTGRSTF